MAQFHSSTPMTSPASGPGIRRISGRGIFISKRIFPLLWFGFLAFFVSTAWRGNAPVMFFVVPVFMGAMGYLMMKKFVFDLADEVWDRGDALVVRKGKQEELIPLSVIMNVSYTTMQSPNRVTLTLREPCRFGREVSFMPPTPPVWNPFAKIPIIEELIARIDAARSR